MDLGLTKLFAFTNLKCGLAISNHCHCAVLAVDRGVRRCNGLRSTDSQTKSTRSVRRVRLRPPRASHPETVPRVRCDRKS